MTTFKDEADALATANGTLYGLGAGVWSRDGHVACRMGRAIKAGRVWTNCYHADPAHACFDGYKESSIGPMHTCSVPFATERTRPAAFATMYPTRVVGVAVH